MKLRLQLYTTFICILPLGATLIGTINGHHFHDHCNPDPSRHVYESGSTNIGNSDSINKHTKIHCVIITHLSEESDL